MKLLKKRRAGFTMIEMMVVVALVGILIAGVFKLMGAAGESAKRAKTMARMQKLENAIAGFYSEYGTYPPVPLHGSPDPFMEEYDGKFRQSSRLDSQNATRAARAQPVSFEYPCKIRDNAHLHNWFASIGEPNVISANEIINSFDLNKTDWQNTKLFKFGLLSFLLPRMRTIADFDSNGNINNRRDGPDEAAFDRQQWKIYNAARRGSYASQLSRESAACARWLPNLEGIVSGGPKVMGVDTQGAGHHWYASYTQGGQTFGLRRSTLLDGWDREFYYYSAPPYQSYRLWSAGPDGQTFPPGFSLNDLKKEDRVKVGGWIKDDVVGFDR